MIQQEILFDHLFGKVLSTPVNGTTEEILLDHLFNKVLSTPINGTTVSTRRVEGFRSLYVENEIFAENIAIGD